MTKKSKSLGKKIMLGVLIGYVLVVIAVYLGVSFYFSNHFTLIEVLNKNHLTRHHEQKVQSSK